MEGFDKDRAKQYIGKFQKNIAKVEKVGWSVKQGECQEIDKYVSKYEK